MPTTSSLSVRHLINAMRWEEAMSRLEDNPSEAFSDVPFGETALSTACRLKGAPPRLIEALLNANPDAALQRTLQGGRTPLHIACSDLRRTSQGDGFEDDFEIIRLILSARPEAAAVPDEDMWLPLHCACFASGNLGILRALIEEYPASFAVANRDGVTPLAMVWERNALNEGDGRCFLSPLAARFYDRVGDNDRVGDARNPSYSSFTTQQAYNRRGITMPRNNSAAVWAKVMLMARAAFNEKKKMSGTASATTFRALHALAGMECHPSMFEFALRVHGDPNNGEALRLADEGGNLPLHIAAAVPITQLTFGLSETSESARGALVRMLLDAYPRAVRMQNLAGRVPLNLAIQAGASWERGVVRILFEAAPEAVEARDVESKLYPFMLAASVNSLDISYQLLRLSPNLVARGCCVDADLDVVDKFQSLSHSAKC